MDGRGGMLFGTDAQSVWVPDLANTAVSRGHSRWCLVSVEPVQASLNTSQMTKSI